MELVLWQPVASTPENILVHGISGDQQRSGVQPDEALRLFSAFAGADTLVAYHADFDRQFLERAGCRMSRASWIDAAWLVPALLNGQSGNRQSLDAWCAACGITHAARHNAVSDAFATAELLLILLERAARKGIQTVGALQACADDARWLARLIPIPFH